MSLKKLKNTIPLLISFLLYSISAIGYSEDIQSHWEKWTSEQINENFASYEISGVTLDMLDATVAWNTKWKKIAYPTEGEGMYRYRVVDSAIYRSPPGHPKWADLYGMSAVEVLTRIIKKYPLPDVEFIYLEFDTPHFNNAPVFLAPDGSRPIGPIFVGSKSKLDDNLILYHDYSSLHFFEETASSQLSSYSDSAKSFTLSYDWNWLSKKLSKDNSPVWGKKVNKLYWRGRHTEKQYYGDGNPSPREYLVILSDSYPNLIDARFGTGYSIELHLQHKYQIVMDGSTAQFPGYLWRLLSGCLSFKQKSPVTQWFEAGLIPDIHYVLVENDLSDLFDKIIWAQKNDRSVEIIADNARHFVLEQAMPEHCLKYCYKVLLKYASLQRFIIDDPLSGNTEFELIADPLTEEEKKERRITLQNMRISSTK